MKKLYRQARLGRSAFALGGEMTVDELKPAPDDHLQRWSVSKRVNSSKADKG